MSDQPPGDPEARLLAALGAALEPDEPPVGLVQRANALVELLDLDSDLAALVEPALEPVGARGTATDGRLSFASADGDVAVEVAVEVAVDVSPSQGTLAGQVLSGAVVLVVLESLRGEAATAAVDDLGRFALVAARGPVRLRLRTASAREVVTDWFLA